MSEQEKQGSGGTEGSAVVMVDQTESHVKPYRPTEIQDSDMHHKRSRAPAAPSLAEELRKLAKDAIANQIIDSKELKESERAMSSEKKSSKRKDSSPDIPLQPLGEDSKRDSAADKLLQQKTIPTPTQPIPSQIHEEKSESQVLQVTKEDEERTLEEDSIIEEVTELQSPVESKKRSEWNDSQKSKKHKSRINKEHQRTVVMQDLGTRSQDWILERKASVGPCFRPGMPFEGPSGITICVPKKSSRCCVHDLSGININVSRKSVAYKSKSQNINFQTNNLNWQEKRFKLTEPDNKMTCEIAYAKFFNNLKEKIESVRGKIKCAFNM